MMVSFGRFAAKGLCVVAVCFLVGCAESRPDPNLTYQPNDDAPIFVTREPLGGIVTYEPNENDRESLEPTGPSD